MLLSTFHKAKGLEFPVVILYRIAQSPERQTAGVVHDRAHKVVEFKSGSWETAGFRRVKEDEQDRQDYESRRLFYVACTRARDVLVIPAYWQSAGKRRESSRFTAMLEARYPAGSDGIPQIADSGFHLHPTEPLTLEAEPQEGLLLNMTETIEENAAQEARRERQNWEERRAAAVARLDHAREFIKPSEHSAPEAERETSALRRAPVSAANFGLFVHRLLQKADLPDGKNLAELAVSPFIEPGLSDTERSEGLQLAERALRSPLFQKRLAKAEKVFRELGFTAAVEGRIVEGALDLLFFENGQPVIVDFKTDRVSVEQIPARAESYRHQAAVYARAMEAVLNKPVREVILYFLRPGTIKAFTRDVLLPVDL